MPKRFSTGLLAVPIHETPFKKHGTINIDGVFDYILKPEIFGLIEEEFDMYLYHLRDEQDGQKHRGWMRDMFYLSNSLFGRTPSTMHSLQLHGQIKILG